MERGCINFRCVRRRGCFCCADCREQDVCQVACQNSPERCGLARENVPGNKEVREYTKNRKDGRT